MCTLIFCDGEGFSIRDSIGRGSLCKSLRPREISFAAVGVGRQREQEPRVHVHRHRTPEAVEGHPDPAPSCAFSNHDAQYPPPSPPGPATLLPTINVDDSWSIIAAARSDISWDRLCSSIILAARRIASVSLVVVDPLPPSPLPPPPPSASPSLSHLQNDHHAALGGSNNRANANATVAMDPWRLWRWGGSGAKGGDGRWGWGGALDQRALPPGDRRCHPPSSPYFS